MNDRPLNPITAEHIADFRRDGVVCLRQMIDADWIGRLQEGAAHVIAHPEEYGPKGPSHGPMVSVSYLWRRPGVFRDFALQGPAGEIIGRVIEADTIQMFHDHLFVKPPRSPKVMQWHADHGWPFRGTMIPNLWIALSPVNAENGRIEFLAGYHKYCIENGVRYGAAGVSGSCPDFEARRGEPGFPFRFVTWDLEPGDAVLFHFHTPHFSKGNESPTQARAGLAFRVIGDDAVWCARSDLAPIPGLDVPAMPDGVHPEPSSLLPVIWRREHSAARAAA